MLQCAAHITELNTVVSSGDRLSNSMTHAGICQILGVQLRKHCAFPEATAYCATLLNNAVKEKGTVSACQMQRTRRASNKEGKMSDDQGSNDAGTLILREDCKPAQLQAANMNKRNNKPGLPLQTQH
jgi:hypothetical protein